MKTSDQILSSKIQFSWRKLVLHQRMNYRLDWKGWTFWQFPFCLLEIWIFYQKIEECGWRVSERRVKWLSCSHTLFLRPQQQAFLTAFRGEYQKVLHLSLLELLKDEKAFESHKIKLFKPFSFFKQKYGNIWIFAPFLGTLTMPISFVLWDGENPLRHF